MSNKPYRKAIKCVETGELFISISEAARSLNMSGPLIHDFFKGKIKSAKGYHFEYLSEEEAKDLHNPIATKEIVIQRNAIIRGKGKCYNENTNAVLCISTGEVYTSCTDAAISNDVGVGTMSNACRGKSRTTKGKKYCYVKDINEHLDEVAEAIRKSVMYDEFLTKREKHQQLVDAVGNAEYKAACIEYNIQRMKEQLEQANKEIEEARHNLMHFEW